MEWRVIPGFSGYSVSDTGLVRRDVRMHNAHPGPVSISIDRHGYCRCSITNDDGAHKSPFTHQLVAKAFLGDRPDGTMVCHSDGNPSNNSRGNLRYDTATGNVHDAIKHGTQVRGDRQHLSKLTDELVVEIKYRFINEPVTQARLAMEYGLSKSSMMSIIKGDTWAHIPPVGDITGHQKKPPLIGFRGNKKTSEHRGVSYASRRGKWVARGPCENGKPVCLGEFMTEAEAYSAVLEHTGKVRPNIPERHHG